MVKTPQVRLRAAMTRCSRDRWLSPEDVRTLAYSFAKCVSNNTIWTAEFYMKSVPGCEAVGMIRGTTPFPLGSPSYLRFLEVLRNKNKRKLKTVEEEILRITLKEMST